MGSNNSLNFSPANITVVIGVNNIVTWIDSDPAPHTVTSTSVPPGASSFDSGPMNAGAKFIWTFSVPGTYDYYCSYYPSWMKGTVIVKVS